MSLASGTRLGPYEILAPLGAGGMGEVYRARDTRLGRGVAIKVLPAAFSADPDRLRRFEQEARAASALNHPNILAIYDVGTHGGEPYVVSELLEGETLRERLGGLALSARKAVDYGIQTAEGLAAAHEKGIVHRDLKPENLFVTKDGRVKILDFGLVKLTRPEVPSGPLTEVPTATAGTEPGLVMGTVGYMSPEQVRGQAVDHRSDIFAFGAILYETLAGRRAFRGDSAVETMNAILKEDPLELSETSRSVPPALERIVRRCLEKRAEERFQSARDIAFALEETVSGSASQTAAAWPAWRSRWILWPASLGIGLVALLAVLLALNAGGLKERLFGGGQPAPIRSLAVLPLENLSRDPEQEYFADGMTEALITDLAQIGALRVISRTSVMRYKGTEKSLREIARELNVDGVVEGSVLRAGERVRITAQLIQAPTDRHLWAKSYERNLRDVLALQSEIARAITDEIRIKITREERARLSKSRPLEPEAYQLYLKGRYFWNKRSEEGFKRGIDYFNQAIHKDPNYALAYAGLAYSYNLLGHELYSVLHPREAYPKAKAAATKALELDETLAEAHSVLADIRFRYDWDWLGAEREHKRAIELNPGYATAHQWYSHYLLPMGRTDESLAESKLALELDPLSLIINLHLGWHYLYVRQYDKAIEQLRKTLELDPNFVLARLFLGQAYEQKAMHEEAIVEFQKAISLSRGGPVHVAALGHAYAVSGKRGEAQKVLERLIELSKRRYVPSYEISVIYAGLGDKEQAFAWLQKAYEERDSSWLLDVNLDPRFDDLRSDPRFADLVRRVGLPP